MNCNHPTTAVLCTRIMTWSWIDSSQMNSSFSVFYWQMMIQDKDMVYAALGWHDWRFGIAKPCYRSSGSFSKSKELIICTKYYSTYPTIYGQPGDGHIRVHILFQHSVYLLYLLKYLLYLIQTTMSPWEKLMPLQRQIMHIIHILMMYNIQLF